MFIFYVNAKTKQKFIQRRNSGSTKSKQIQIKEKSWQLYSGKTESGAPIDSVEPGTAVTSQVHREIFSKLDSAIQNRRRGMLRSGIVVILKITRVLTRQHFKNSDGKFSITPL